MKPTTSRSSAAMHDLTLAGQYGRRIVLLDKGSVVADGTPSAVLEADLLGRVYGARVRNPGPAQRSP